MRLIHVARATGAALFATLLLAGLAVTSQAEDGPKIVRIVEEWEMTLASPDATTTAPQVTLAFSPLGDLSSLHATFEMNHQATPSFAPGGLHLHLWNGDQRLDARHQGGQTVLRTTGEVVTWKQTLDLRDGQLTFAVADGQSATWGSFGDGGSLSMVVATDLESLNGYSPDVSVRQSGVGYAGNRVSRLVLKKVTAVTSEGRIVEDSTDRVAHEP